jgi:hypothetical protein
MVIRINCTIKKQEKARGDTGKFFTFLAGARFLGFRVLDLGSKEQRSELVPDKQ